MSEEKKPEKPINTHGSTTTVSRNRLSQLAGQHFEGERDLYEVLGYPRDLQPNDYTSVYLRQDIAGRAVDAYPDATWREVPSFKAEPPFIEKFTEIADRLKLWRALHRLDRLMNLGHYGVLLLGLDGGENMSQPATKKNYRLMYVQPHSERTAQITEWESDVNNPRYGKPKRYRITSGVNWTGTGGGQRVLDVHHSRVIHVAERALEDESIGTPRLERVFNRLMDLDKLAGGGAEIYWQNASMMMAFIANAETEIEPEDKKAMEEQFTEMQNRLRRFLTLQGVDAKNLAPGLQGSDPGPLMEWQVKLVSAALAIPQRILMGNEAGELASSQDETAWSSRVAERREQLAGPTFIEAFINAGQRLGFLPGGYKSLEWPEDDTLGEAARADIALKKTQAVQAYTSSPGADLLVTESEFRDWVQLEGDVPLLDDEEPIDEDDPLLTDAEPESTDE